jgi:signal transduction histidine kinase
MLVFARGARPDDPRVRIDLAALARSVVDDANDLGHTVPFVAAGPVWVIANASLLQRVLENLLSNALSYGQNVRVEVVHRDDQAEVHVTDEGPGLPDEALEQVFEPFFRLEASRSRKTGGTGLGLAIARAIARSHGGDVTVTNRKSGGLDACLSLTGLGDDRVGR